MRGNSCIAIAAVAMMGVAHTASADVLDEIKAERSASPSISAWRPTA